MNINSFLDAFEDVTPIGVAGNYYAIEFEPGAKYIVSFKSGKMYYLAFSKNTTQPFLNYNYIGAILVVRDAKQLYFVGQCNIRCDGQAVVLCDRVGQRYITACGEHGDLFYLNTGHDAKERQAPVEDYLEYLRDNFKSAYFRLWVGEPDTWKECFEGILQRIRPLKFEGGKLFIV